MGCAAVTAKRRRRQAKLAGVPKKSKRGDIKPHIVSQRYKTFQSIWPQYNRNRGT